VVNSPASNSDGTVLRDKRVSSIQQNYTILQKGNVSTWKMLRDGNIAATRQLNSHRNNTGMTLLFLTQMENFKDKHVFVQFSRGVLICTKWMFLPLENDDR
jgi:hypothetical protein